MRGANCSRSMCNGFLCLLPTRGADQQCGENAKCRVAERACLGKDPSGVLGAKMPLAELYFSPDGFRGTSAAVTPPNAFGVQWELKYPASLVMAEGVRVSMLPRVLDPSTSSASRREDLFMRTEQKGGDMNMGIELERACCWTRTSGDQPCRDLRHASGWSEASKELSDLHKTISLCAR